MKIQGTKLDLRPLRTFARRGFTLIEMLLVLVILGILASIIVPRMVGSTLRAHIVAAQTQIASFKHALNAFEVDNGFFPQGQNGLEALVIAPRDANGWKGPYMEAIPLDPWQHPYVYQCPGKHASYAFDIASAGPDGRLGSDDDIVSWLQPIQRP